MAEYFMGQELIQGELPANSPKPSETPPEGVIMTDLGRDGSSRRYIYIAMAGSIPEEIVISETPGQKKRVSGAAVAVEEMSFDMEGSSVDVPEGVIMPQGALLPEGAVFSGLPGESRPVMAGRVPTSAPATAPRMAGPVQGPVPMVARQNPMPQVQPQQQTYRAGLSVPPPVSVPTITIQKAAPQAPVLVQASQTPVPGVEVQVPFIQRPIEQSQEMGNVKISNSIEALRPVTVQSVADGPRTPERPVPMLGQSRSLPLTTQEARKQDTYPVNNPIAPSTPMGGMAQIGAPGYGQNQIPLRHLGQTPAPAAAASTPPATPGKCPGAVEMPDGRTIEPGDYITLEAMCELMPFLVQTLTDMQGKGLAPGQKVPVVGQQANGQTAVPTSASFGPAGQGGSFGRAAGGMAGFGGGGGGPGPAGVQGPIGLTGATGPGSITEPPVVKVDGDFTAGPGAFVPVPGTAVPFTMSAAGVAEVKVLLTLGSGATQLSESAQIGVRINGTDYPLTVRLIDTSVAGVGEFDIGQSFLFPVQLAAGSYTAELLLRGLLPGEFGGGSGAAAAVNANPSIPLIITVTHN